MESPENPEIEALKAQIQGLQQALAEVTIMVAESEKHNDVYQKLSFSKKRLGTARFGVFTAEQVPALGNLKEVVQQALAEMA